MDEKRRPQPHLRSIRTDAERDRDARLRDALEGTDWRDITARLTATAYRMMRKKAPIADAEDVAQKAITQMLDPDYKDWDPSEGPLFEHLEKVAWGIVHTRFHSATEKRRAALDEKRTRVLPTVGPAVDDIVAAREIHDRVFAELRATFARKSLELSIVELFREGVHLPRDQVEEIDLSYRQVYDARWRVVQAARRILAELEKSHGEG